MSGTSWAQLALFAGLVGLATPTSSALSTLDRQLLELCGENKKNVHAVKKKLDEGAQATASSSMGETALHLACIYGDADVIEVLLANGAKPNLRATAEKSLQMTPLTWCAYAGYTEAVKALLAGGADANQVVLKEDGSRLTALDIARLIGPRGTATATELANAGGQTWKELLEPHLSKPPAKDDWQKVIGVLLPDKTEKREL